LVDKIFQVVVLQMERRNSGRDRIILDGRAFPLRDFRQKLKNDSCGAASLVLHNTHHVGYSASGHTASASRRFYIQTARFWTQPDCFPENPIKMSWKPTF